VSCELRAHLHELWTDPAAAVGLAGRSSGLAVETYGELGGEFWLGSRLGAELLTADAPGQEREHDGRILAELSVGRRLLAGDIAIADRFRARRVPAGPTSPFLLDTPANTRDLLVNVWCTLQGQRLLGDAGLAAILPVGRRNEYVLLAGRADQHVAEHLGISMAAHFGRDIELSDSIWGFDAGLSWRPERGAEFTATVGHGSVLGGVGGDATEVQLQAVLRW
jgi:hypothetical protein